MAVLSGVDLNAGGIVSGGITPLSRLCTSRPSYYTLVTIFIIRVGDIHNDLQFHTFTRLNTMMKITGSDIHLLTVFDSVVRNRGFSAAQVELGLSQPTISNHITALEERLGVKLCQRGRRGFLLTEKGQIVHQLGLRLLDTLDEHSTHLAALKSNLVGNLKIAVVDAVTTDPNFQLPKALKAFTDQAPAVRIELSISDPQSIMTSVLDGSCHIGLGSFDTIANGLVTSELYEENHALYCADTHPLFGVADDVICESEIRNHARTHRGYWSQRRQKSFSPSEMDRYVLDIEAQLMMVLSGSYLGLLPTHVAHSFVEAGQLRRVPFDGDDYACTMHIITRSGRVPKVNALFISLLKGLYP